MQTKNSHVFIFGLIFTLILIFIFYKLSFSLQLEPDNNPVHTSVIYYDGDFSEKLKSEDTLTALYVINESQENILASAYEYDQNRREVNRQLNIEPGKSQYIKPNGPAVVYLNNENNTKSSKIKFITNRWGKYFKYTIPVNILSVN